MKNQEISLIFKEIADFLSMDDRESFRVYAYRKAALILDSLEEDVESLYQREGIKGLINLPGIGRSLSFLIKEYLDQGKIRYHQELKKKTPVDLESLFKVEGLGARTVKTLYQELGVKNIKDLEKNARQGKIRSLFGFGLKKEQKILENIEFLSKTQNRIFIGQALPEARRIKKLIESLKGVEKVSLAGSLRRGKESIKDIDILVSSLNPSETALKIPLILGKVKIINQGETKISIKTNQNYQVDFRIVKPESYGSALQYFTGSKEHNIYLRRIAIKKKMKINEYGIFKKQKKIGGYKEEEIYHALGLNFIPPELRENDELNDKINLIEIKDIKGDLHCHSNWSGGENTIKEMALKAISLNYSYIGIADHTKNLVIERGLDEKDLIKQRKEIDGIKLGIKILHGCEANILKDGSLDIDKETLSKLDFVIAGVHSFFKMNKKEMTQRIIKAIENPLVDIIAHPTGRILGRRDEYQIDFNAVLKKAQETNTVLEINASPQRLDLNDVKIRRAKEMKVKMVINSDSHHQDQLDLMEYGVTQARRGSAEKKDIVNASKILQLKRNSDKIKA